MVNETRSCTQLSTSSEGSLDLNTNVILRVECISRLSLKKFVIVKFFLHWTAVSMWLAITALTSRKVLSRHPTPRDFHLNTAISALCLTAALLVLSTLVYFLVRVSRSQQQWTQARRRLVLISIYQLTCLVVATASFFAASCYASKRGCNSICSFCIWSFFVQWTAWNTLLFVQLLLTHSACVWTDGQAKPQRRLLMHLSPWLRNKPKNAMILEAPWIIHLPKLLLWMLIEATLVFQLVNSLQGRIYRPHALHIVCRGSFLEICKRSSSNEAATITRCVAIGLTGVWQITVVCQGMHDMARMPMDAFRMGRILIRMVSSSQISAGTTLIPFLSLLLASLQSGCVSCQPNYLIMGLIVSCTTLLGLGSFLIHPKSRSTDDDILMQAWLQRFAWTEQKLAACKRKRDALPRDPTLLRDEPMFCFETAVKLLYWAGFVYEHDEGSKIVDRTEETAMKLYNLEQVEVIRDPLTSTKCLVAWGPDTIVVAFRGTANRQNAAHDIKAWLVPHTPETGAKVGCGLGPTAAVHSGFSLSWGTALKEGVHGALQQAIKQSGQDASQMCLYVTGHSLGGALAVLAAFDIADLHPWGTLQVYTVGAPRPGNSTFAAQYNAKVPHTWHVMNPQDPVPKVGKFWGLFARPGQRVLVNERGDMQVRPTPLDRKLTPLSPVHIPILQRFECSLMACCMPSVKTHFLTNYRASLVSIVEAELKRPRFEEGLEGVLNLASSISLEDTLAAADLAANASGRSLTTTAAIVSSDEDPVADAV